MTASISERSQASEAAGLRMSPKGSLVRTRRGGRKQSHRHRSPARAMFRQEGVASRALPQYRSGATEDDFERLREMIRNLAAQGPFDANDALSCALSEAVTNNAGDVAAILGDMVDLGELRRLPDEGGAQRYGAAGD